AVPPGLPPADWATNKYSVESVVEAFAGKLAHGRSYALNPPGDKLIALVCADVQATGGAVESPPEQPSSRAATTAIASVSDGRIDIHTPFRKLRRADGRADCG